jgi:hypothetical protein
VLRITVHAQPDSVTFQLEGRLTGVWVREFEGCVRSVLADRPRPVVRIDLREVTSIDEEGKACLKVAHVQGFQFIASGCLMRAMVAEMAQGTSRDGPLAPGEPGGGGRCRARR